MPAWQLFLVAVLVWGSTWHVILYQLAQLPAEAGVALRFGLAGALILLVRALRGLPWRLTARQQLHVGVPGIFMYGLAYVCVYQAERFVPTGLVAVGYSASPLINGAASHLLWGTPLRRRLVLGGLCGMAGVAAIFWPQLAGVAASPTAGRGALFTIGAVLASSVGSLWTSRYARLGIALWPAMGWGMGYGAAVGALMALAAGQTFALPAVASWWLSLFYLAIFGSIVAFGCYLSLQQHWGPGPASMVGVATPVLALGVSAALEGYRPTPLAVTGIVLAVIGNAVALWPARRAALPAEPAGEAGADAQTRDSRVS